MRRFISILSGLLAGLLATAAPARVSLSGTVSEGPKDTPLSGVVLALGDDYLWAISDADGHFSIESIQPGTYTLKASCLGYVDWQMEIKLDKDIKDLKIRMFESSLALDEVVVTAQRSSGASTSHSLGRDALNHMQMSSLSDMSALLPGGRTINPDLTSSASFSLRDGGVSSGNAAFGTAVEVDGVRLGNNAGFGAMGGVDTRSISTDNVESVEVITGVPSVEYGDLNSGMVRIHTRKGRTPLNVNFSVNPRTYQTSVSKGIELGADAGVLNLSAEWAQASKKIDSPYESYTRRGISVAYSNTFAKVLRFEAGLNGNLGGMNSKDDPDAFSGAWSKGNDNSIRANTSLSWQINKPGITSLKAEASVNFADNKVHNHNYNSNASQLPAVHSRQEGYYLAYRLPLTYFSDQIEDSKELDAAASVKYNWNFNKDSFKSKLKAGVQWKTSGNVGLGEYYQDMSLASNGYRPRPYSDYPFMHNFSAYAEEFVSLPAGRTRIELTAGLRAESVYIKGSDYTGTQTLSPRFNLKWALSDRLSIRGGWGVTEKLPSFYILYPKQEYRDIQIFSFSHGDGKTSSYVYYTQPFSMEFNPELKWQRNSNSELGLDFQANGWKVALVGFYNLTEHPYKLVSNYQPFSYNILSVPSDFEKPTDPQIKIDHQTGEVYLRADDNSRWTPMNVKVTDQSFVKTTRQENGTPIHRAGIELTVDTPEIKPLRSSLRLDGSFSWSSTKDQSLGSYYNAGWSHTSLPNRSYQYVGIYPNGGNGSSLVCGKKTSGANANITSITHIPEARLIVTCRVEVSLFTRSLNLPAGSTEALAPSYIMNLDGSVVEFTQAMAEDPQYEHLILKPGNNYVFDQDGYGSYASANLSITKEIGDHVSLSFFANNFTNSRPTVYSMATGIGAIFTPSFYYGLTCRIKF